MEKETQHLEPTHKNEIWDCESSLYDSFELKSFERHLEFIISARTMSMPRLSFSSLAREPPVPQPSDRNPSSKKHSKLIRSFSKLLRLVFGPRHTSTKDGAFYLFDASGPLSTIPEVPDFDLVLPDMKSLVRRTQSDRFMPTSLGISCA